MTHLGKTAIVLGMGQLKLALAQFAWGGRRKGAGRKPTSPGHRMPHRIRPWHDKSLPLHVTLRVVGGLRSLRDKDLTVAIGESFRALVGSERAKRFRICAFSLQTDHVHLLVEASNREALSKGMRSVTIRIAKAVNRTLGRRGKVVQDRFHVHVLKTPMDVRNALVYVFFNCFKHRVRQGEIENGLDCRSSAAWFPGWTHVRPLTARPPVSPAETWLRGTGWTMHGLLRRWERPAAVR